MELDSMDGILDELSVEGKVSERPVFLTVLCVLTFVGSAVYMIYAAFTLLGYSQIDKVGLSIMNGLDEEFLRYIRWVKIERYSMIVGGMGCIAGAILMLKTKKVGFYIYVASQILPLVVGFLTATSIGNFLGGFQFVSFILWSIFPAGFIILYSLNYKHLK